jgi:hypothetical protein
MSERANVFCPFCNAEGARQPILSPMAVVYILGAGAAPAESGEAEATRQVAPRASHFEYRCPRCGFTEIHERLLGEAA